MGCIACCGRHRFDSMVNLYFHVSHLLVSHIIDRFRTNIVAIGCIPKSRSFLVNGYACGWNTLCLHLSIQRFLTLFLFKFTIYQHTAHDYSRSWFRRACVMVDDEKRLSIAVHEWMKEKKNESCFSSRMLNFEVELVIHRMTVSFCCC